MSPLHEFAEDAGALLTQGWLLLPVMVLGGVMCGAVGFRSGRRFQARQFVTRAVEDSVAETIALPTQREASR